MKICIIGAPLVFDSASNGIYAISLQGSKREYLAPDWCGNENDSRIDDKDDRIDNDVDRHDAGVENRDYSWCDVIEVIMLMWYR